MVGASRVNWITHVGVFSGDALLQDEWDIRAGSTVMDIRISILARSCGWTRGRCGWLSPGVTAVGPTLAPACGLSALRGVICGCSS
jgi:hypothetical protein